MSKIRLQVVLAKAGVASRRKAAELIESGRVRINGRIVREKGFRINVPRDKISFDGKPIFCEEPKYYYVLNKPPGVLSAARDNRGRKTVLDYVKIKGPRLYPVGRLDRDTTGLIILTNDGDLTYRLTHPKFEVKRVYEAEVNGAVKPEDARLLERGVSIEGKKAQAEKVTFVKKSRRFTILRLMLHEGRKREVRRMFEAVGHCVMKLKRIAYGPLNLADLKEGEARELTRAEVKKLKKTCLTDAVKQV